MLNEVQLCCHNFLEHLWLSAIYGLEHQFYMIYRRIHIWGYILICPLLWIVYHSIFLLQDCENIMKFLIKWEYLIFLLRLQSFMSETSRRYISTGMWLFPYRYLHNVAHMYRVFYFINMSVLFNQ